MGRGSRWNQRRPDLHKSKKEGNMTTCECVECVEFDGPDPAKMKLRFTILGAQLLVALLGLIRERSWKALFTMFGAIVFFAFVPRRLICCRCEGYGKNCYSLYLGKITSMYLPKEEGEVSPLGAALEVVALAIIANAPAVGLRKNKKLLALYMLLGNLTIWFQFSHACRHCATYATDWKKDCPSAMAARKFFGGRAVQF